MKIFISWSTSGESSKQVASALKSWLPYVFPGIQVWMSDHDIQAGTRWGAELAKGLNDCNLGIICLTPESLESRWLTFEAGALSNAMTGSRVIPYLFNVRSADVGPPLSQFEHVTFDDTGEGTYKLVRSINNAFEKPLFDQEEKLKVVFDHWWRDLRTQLQEIHHSGTSHERSEREILEEILDLVRQTGIRGLTGVLSQLFSMRNVRRIEIAKKEIAGSQTNALALRITVAKKLPIAQIPKDEIIPDAIFGMPTDVVEGD